MFLEITVESGEGKRGESMYILNTDDISLMDESTESIILGNGTKLTLSKESFETLAQSLQSDDIPALEIFVCSMSNCAYCLKTCEEYHGQDQQCAEGMQAYLDYKMNLPKIVIDEVQARIKEIEDELSFELPLVEVK